MNKTKLNKSMTWCLGLMMAVAPLASRAAIDLRIYGSAGLGGFEIPGTAVADMVNDDQYPNSPEVIENITAVPGEIGLGGIVQSTTGRFEYPQPFSTGDTGLQNYGAAASGILYPPATGNYTFHVRSDDASQLWLSTDHTRGNAVVVAEELGCCGGFIRTAPEGSEPIALEAGQGYYIEMLMKEGGGGDWFQVGWSFEGGPIQVIPAAYVQRDISSYALNTGVLEVTDLITTPNTFTILEFFVPERETVDFIVEFDFEGVATVQWQVNDGSGWEDIEGATTPIITVEALVPNDGNRYRAVVNGENSDEYTLNVEPDFEIPQVGFVDHRGNPNALIVPFSERVNLEQALDPSNYSVNGSSLPAGAQLLSDHPQLKGDGTDIIILADFGFERGDNITVEVTGIDDLAFNPNTIQDTTRNLLFDGGIPVVYDFNSGLDTSELEIYGSAEVRDTGGVGNSGYLKITDGVGSQLGAALLLERRDINQVTFEFQARIGDTSGRPADGFSFNVADDMPTGTYPQSEEGYAGGEATAPAGLVVAFDNWSSGGSDLGVGIEIKYANESRAFVATPEVTAGGAPTEDANGIPSIHRGPDWFPVSVDLSIDGFATVIYDNVTIMDRVDVGWAGVTNAQAGFGGRTGGAWQSHWFDDVSINYLGPDVGDISVAEQPEGASVNEHQQVTMSVVVGGYPNGGGYQWYRVPAGGGDPVMIEGATGRSYSFTAHPSNAGGYYVVVSNWFSEAQSETVQVEVAPDTTAPEIVSISGSAAQEYVFIQFSEAVTAESAGNIENYTVSGPEGDLEILSVTVLSPTSVSLMTARQADATKYDVSVSGISDLADAANGLDDSGSFVSYQLRQGGLSVLFYPNGGGGLGFYPAENRGMAMFPAGFAPYGTGSNQADIAAGRSTSTTYFESPATGDINTPPPGDVNNNYNTVVFGFIRPPESGDYIFGLANDDNAGLYLSTDDDPANTTLIANEAGWSGVRNYVTVGGGSVSADKQSEPISLEAGQDYYVEVVTGEGGGGDNTAVAWSFSADGFPDPIVDGALPIPAEFLWGWQPAFEGVSVINASPANGASGVFIDNTGISFDLRDGIAEEVDPATVVLRVNGQVVDASVEKEGDTTTVSFAGADSNYATGATVNVSVSYSTTGGEARNLTWSFQTENIQSLMYAAPLDGAGDAGMTVKVRQGLDDTGAARPTTIADAEAQIAEEWGNIEFEADDVVVDYINHNQDGDGSAAGRFGDDIGMITAGLMSDLNTDSITWEVITYIEFPTAGPVTMVVNSDDGFLVTHGEDPSISEDDLRLGLFDGGRGASDTVFRFIVPEPGIYPFRLLWFEGGGGANVEWFTVDGAGVRHLINDPNDDAAFNAFVTASPIEMVEVITPVDAEITSVSVSGGNISIEYTGTLQSAPSVNGPWSNVAGSSPYSEAVENGAKFFRAVE